MARLWRSDTPGGVSGEGGGSRTYLARDATRGGQQDKEKKADRRADGQTDDGWTDGREWVEVRHGMVLGAQHDV